MHKDRGRYSKREDKKTGDSGEGFFSQPEREPERHPDSHPEREPDTQPQNSDALDARCEELPVNLFLDYAQELITFQDPDLNILWANKTASKAFNRQPRDLIGEKCYAIVQNRNDPCPDCPVLRAIETGERCSIEKETAGGRFWHIIGIPVTDADGNVSGAVEIALEQTEKKALQTELEKQNILLEGTINAIPDIIGIQYPDYQILRYNRAGYEFLNMSPDQVKGKKCYELLGRNDICPNCATTKALETREPTTIEKYFPEQDKYVKANANPVLNQAGQVEYIIEQLQDITQYKKALEALQESEEKFRSYVENANDLIFTLDTTGVIHYVSPNCKDFLGYTPEEMTRENIIGGIHPDDYQKTKNYLDRLIQKGEPLEQAIENRVYHKNGEIRWLATKLNLIKDRKGDTYLLGIARDITERKQAEEKIQYLSFHDMLTGLYNRAYMEEEMHRLNTERQLPLSIIMCDLNGLKLVNDTYGHEFGDEMLQKAATLLQNNCRREDLIARWGGDEFVILLPHTSVQIAQNVVDRISENTRNVYVKDIPVSLSLGTSTKTSPQTPIKETLKDAEDQMYRQKLAESKSARSAVLNTLNKTLAAKSFETEAHAQRMLIVAWHIGEKLQLPDSELHRLNLLITLHDIGKINIPEEVLTKKEALENSEWELVKKHPEIGYRIARATDDFAHVADEILTHHERWDGQGYPRGLTGEDIPLLARITAIADAYDVMSNGRPYKQAMSKEAIKTEFRRCAGTQFDPHLVDIFLTLLEQEEI